MDSEKMKVTWDDLNSTSQPPPPIIIEPSLGDVTEAKPKANKFNWGIAVVVLVVLFVGFIAFSLYHETCSRHAIETVLRADKKADQDVKKSDSASAAVISVVQKMRSIELSECPKDFQTAYQKHIEAWAKLIPVLRKADEVHGLGSVLKDFCIGFISGLTGRFDIAINKTLQNLNTHETLKKEAEKASSEIKSTYLQVLKVARKYKVNTAPYSN